MHDRFRRIETSLDSGFEVDWIRDANMDTPPVKRRPRPHRKANQSAKYVAYVLVALGITTMIFYANYERVMQLEAMMIRRSQVEAQLTQDPRFHALRIKINNSTGFTVVSGTVATKSDLDALRVFLRWNRAPVGTKWKLAVDLPNAPQTRPIFSGPAVTEKETAPVTAPVPLQ